MAARGPYAKGVAKREEILDVALAHFAERGYDRASVREVARLAGLTQAGLLHHFSSKEELFLAVLRRRDDRYDETSNADHTQSIQRLIAAAERNADEPGLVRLYVSMSAEIVEGQGPSRTFFEDRYTWLRGEISADISGRIERGELPADFVPDDVASVLIAVADGLQIQWLLEPDKVDMERLLRSVWDALKDVHGKRASD